MRKRKVKPNSAEALLSSIYIKHKCKTMAEAQEIYRKMYEDVEFDPKRVVELIKQK